jgi:hypothetical protein
LLPYTFCRKWSALKVTHEQRRRYSMPSTFCRCGVALDAAHAAHASERALLRAALPS